MNSEQCFGRTVTNFRAYNWNMNDRCTSIFTGEYIVVISPSFPEISPQQPVQT